MSLRNFRVFTIILVIELAVFESQVEAFTIQRPADVTSSDLSVAESTHRLEVRNDLKRDVKPKVIKNDSPPLTVPIKTTAKTEEIQKNANNMTNITASANTKPALASPKGTTKALEIEASNETTTSTTIPTATSAEIYSINLSSNTTQKTTIASTTPTVTIVNTTYASEDRNKIFDDNSNKLKTSSLTWPALRNTKENTTSSNMTSNNKNESTVNSTNVVNGTNHMNATNRVTSTTKMNPISLLNITKLVNVGNETKTASKLNLTKTYVPSPNTNNITLKNMTSWKNNTENDIVESKTEESNFTSYSTEAVYTSTNKTIYDVQRKSNTSKNESDSKIVPDVKTNSSSQKSSEELTGEHSGVTVIPYWKKYTTIERMKKRLNTTKDNVTSTEYSAEILPSAKSISSSEKDLLQSGTAQTERNVSLEKALNTVSEIPSLELLKNQLLASKMTSTPGYTSSSSESTNDIGAQKNSTTQTGKTGRVGATLEITTQAYNVVSSKRAGFLDFSTRPMIKAVTSNNSQESAQLTESYTNVSTSKTTPRNPTSKTSQSQLVEDAIKEELMKEEFLMDSVENAQRQQDERFGSETKPTENIQRAAVNLTTSDTSTEDKLRVKPINIEKPKNGSLYVVSPNYKPLKKIEVQPPKPFVRNPDDNSWRNESLSSLGIVFKANNSSKPFTQVLKNKTETEWNNLLDRYDKGDEPELRTRLEKIAEIRKSKKKKVNSFGETVYSDYEEAVSTENSNSSNLQSFRYPGSEGNISSFLDEVEKDKLKSIQPQIFDVETTTVKARKFLDEYEEDDESDYTLPNIDIKKFITSTATSAIPGRPSVLPIQLTSPIFSNTPKIHPSDRQPTIQYFPPIEKNQKVVINDYDTVFQKKINVFTTDTPSTFTTPVRETPPAPVTFDFQKNKFEPPTRPISRRPDEMDKNLYVMQPQQEQRTQNGYVSQYQDAAGYNQASNVIKHLRDFIDEVVKADEGSITDEPLRGVTVNSVVHETKPKPSSDYYDYEAQFRKDVINRFAENFNQNSERFKADFPVLYNTSIVHAIPGSSLGGESTAFMKRLYEDVRVFQHPKYVPKRLDTNCDHTVELSPAYELHYYVPEEEEKEEVELKTLTRPPQHRIRL